MTEKWTEIGTIVAAQGIKGELRVNPDSDFPERFLEPGQRWLKTSNNSEPKPVELLKGYQIPGKNLYVIELEGIEDRTEAESLRGSQLLVPASDRPQLEEDEYHINDLIDLEVRDRVTGENIGVVVDVFLAGNYLLEVKLHKQPQVKDIAQIDTSKINRKSKIPKKQPKSKKPATILIPFVKEIVPLVDIENKRLEITPPGGLLELNRDLE